jgi:hypothetical protein
MPNVEGSAKAARRQSILEKNKECFRATEMLTERVLTVLLALAAFLVSRGSPPQGLASGGIGLWKLRELFASF